MHKKIPQKRRADLARKCTALSPKHNLRADLDILRSAQCLGDFWNGGEWRNNHDLHIGDFANVAKKRLNKPLRLDLRHVHLPIGCDDFFAHVICFLTGESELKSLRTGNK